MARPYSDYLEVNENFVPVFNVHEDENHPEYWKSFYPHESFRRILNDMISTLEGATTENKRSLWIHGSYGTGKTFASFTLKHVIEEADEKIKEYFHKYNIQESLLKRLEGIKSKGDILVVHRSASSDITGDNRLFIVIQESVKKMLKERGYSYFGGKTLYDDILDAIKDPDAVFNFRKVFQNNREKFTHYNNVEDIIKDLEKLGPDNSRDVITRIVELAEASNFYFGLNVDSVIMWLEDIIKENNLYSIIFIWDEFTDYFLKNPNSTSGLQEIAHAAGRIPFYFILITHKSHEQFIHDLDTRKKLEARFKISRIDMAETTAFMLMRNALEFRPETSEEWTGIKENMWFKLEKMVKNTINRYYEDIKDKDLKGLLPLHPFSSILLQDISSKIGSDKRTMFQFLCGDPNINIEEARHNFRWFIKNFDISSWPFLTSDYLWDYFFDEENNPDLDERSKNAISHFHIFLGQCNNENEKRVLKVALLLTAIQRERGRGITNLLRPTLQNIIAAFNGTPLEDNIKNILDAFVKKGIFGSIPEGEETLYISSSQSTDEETLIKLERQLRSEKSFEKIISDSNNSLDEYFTLTGYAVNRFQILYASHKNLKERLASVRNIDKNKIPLIFMYAKNEEDVEKNNIIIKEVITEYNQDIIIADTSKQPLLENEYSNFIRNEAKAQYFEKIDINQMRSHKTLAKKIIDSWKSKINQTLILIYNTQDPKPIEIIGPDQFNKRIREINSRVFPNGLEDIASHDSMFKPTGFSERVAEYGMDDRFAIPASFNYLQVFKQKIAKIWNNPNYYNEYPLHPISKMRIEVEKVINDSFKLNSRVGIIDIWSKLKEKPFGLTECIGSAFVVGFLLKEYAGSGYYKKDSNSNNVSLTHNNLADMIVGIIKGAKYADSQYIVRMTAEHELFCESSCEIFRLSIENQNSIQDAMKGIIARLSTIYEYPLWALKYYFKNEGDLRLAEEVMPIIDLYCEFISSNKTLGRDETKIAEDIVKLFNQNDSLKGYLKGNFNSDNFKKGMKYYVNENHYELISLSEEIGKNDEFIKDIKEKFSYDSSWLWEKGDIDSGIEDVILDYRIINVINSIIGQPVSTFSDAAEAIHRRISTIRIPFELFKNHYPELAKLFGYLIDIYNKKSLKEINRESFLEELQNNAELLNNFFSSQRDIFKTCLKDLLKDNLNDDEINELYRNTESNAIQKSLYDYEIEIMTVLDNYQKRKKYSELIEKWKQLTETNSPAEWSANHRVPILCLFDNEISESQKAFEIINSGTPKAADFEIEEAIRFLGKSVNIKNLANNEECERIFKNFAAGEYGVLFENVEEIKGIISQHVGDNYYDWFIRKNNIEDVVKKVATKKYSDNFYKQVFSQIDKMTPEKTKDYLKELIKNEPLVGIKILKNQ